MQYTLKRLLFAVPAALLVLATLAACTQQEATPTPAATKAAGTQVVGAGATATAAAKAGTAATTGGPIKTVQGLKTAQATPTPAPSPTPLPPGVTPTPPPPPRTPPASYLQPIGDFAYYVENLTSSAVTEWGNQFTEGCAQNTIFPRGSKMVWRIEVVDMKSGRRVMADDASVVVKLPTGQELNGRFSQRGGGRTEGAPWMWATAWAVPLDYAVGTLDYQIVVKHKDGRTGTWKMPYSGTPLKIVE